MPKEICSCEGCKKSLYSISFYCHYCKLNFCIKHRLPEEHKCDIKNSEYYKNHFDDILKRETKLNLNSLEYSISH